MKALLLFLLTCWSTRYSFAQDNIAAQSAKIDTLVKAYNKLDKLNGAVLVAIGDTIIYANGTGVKDFSRQSQNDTSTLFRIYSITKTFTSIVIFKLIEENKLSLSDKLIQFFPLFPNGDSITIENLLTHTSGIYDYTRGNDIKDTSEGSFVDFLAAKPLDFSPGKGWNYSNSGYWLLGYIIQKVTGVTYEKAIACYIFQPLKMDHSGFDFKLLQDPDKATGYELFSRINKKEARDIDPPGPFAAGAMYSTVGDLYKYFKGLQRYELISKESLEKAWTASAINKSYGYGWQLNDYNGKRVIYHGGGGPGFTSNFSMIPGDSICVILLNNKEEVNLNAFTRVIFDVLHGKQLKVPFEINVSPKQLNKYAGYYNVDSKFTMYVTVEDGQLMVQTTGRGKTVALAEKENYFYGVEAEGYLEFKKDDAGDYNEVILRQGGRVLHAPRFYPVWGILGDATSIGWESSQDLSLTKKRGKKDQWELQNIELKSGEIKFRLNNDWNFNYGDNAQDGILDLHGDNIKVVAGLYDLTLDLSNIKKPVFKLIKLK